MGHAIDVLSGYERAYLSVLPEASALRAEQIAHPTTDVESISRGVFARQEQLVQLRPRVLPLPEFSLYDYDQLVPRVSALCHAETNYRMAEETPPTLRAKVTELDHFREQLVPECALLVHHRLVPAHTIAAYKFSNSRRKNAATMRQLVVYLRANWPTISGHTQLSLEHLGDILLLAEEVHTESARTVVDDAERRAAGDIRKRIFTLVDNSLGEVEGALTYLFRKDRGQIKRYMPQCYPNRGHRTRT